MLLWLIAFTDRNPAGHNAVGINSAARHCQTRPNPNTDYIIRGLKSGQADAPPAQHILYILGHLKKWPDTHIHQGYVFVW